MCVAMMIAVQTTQISSTYHLMTLTINRYYAVTSPSLCKTLFTWKRSLIATSLIWISALTSSCSYYLSSGEGTTREKNIFNWDFWHWTLQIYCFSCWGRLGRKHKTVATRDEPCSQQYRSAVCPHRPRNEKEFFISKAKRLKFCFRECVLQPCKAEANLSWGRTQKETPTAHLCRSMFRFIAASYCGMCRFELVWGLETLILSVTIQTFVIPLVIMSSIYIRLVFVIKRQVSAICFLQHSQRESQRESVAFPREG